MLGFTCKSVAAKEARECVFVIGKCFVCEAIRSICIHTKGDVNIFSPNRVS